MIGSSGNLRICNFKTQLLLGQPINELSAELNKFEFLGYKKNQPLDFVADFLPALKNA